MRRFLIKTFLLLLPLLAIAMFCEFSHGLHGTVYKYKYKSLSKHASNVQILSLGSSHSFFGIDPTQFDLRTFNAAHESQDIHFDEFIFDSFFEQMDSLQYLILPISYFSPWSVIEDQEEHWRVKYYQIYYHYPIKLSELKNRIEISSGLRLRTALQEFRLLFNKQTVTELGQGTSNKKQNRSNDWKNSGRIRALWHFYESSYSSYCNNADIPYI